MQGLWSRGAQHKKGGALLSEPTGCHSVSGTERDLNSDKGVGIPQIVYRNEKPEWMHEYAPLLNDGKKFGRQFAIWRSEQAYPKYLVCYKRHRLKLPMQLSLRSDSYLALGCEFLHQRVRRFFTVKGGSKTVDGIVKSWLPASAEETMELWKIEHHVCGARKLNLGPQM